MLGEYSGVCVSTVLSDRQSPTESMGRKSDLNISNSGLAGSNLVLDDFANDGAGPSLVAAIEEVVTELPGTNSPINSVGYNEVGGLESIRGRVETEGFSKESTELYMGKWREGTKSSYQSAWRKWSSWARGRSISPFQANIAQIGNFLSAMFREGKAYSTINGYRSAISAFHPHINKQPVGENPDIRAIMTGIFNKNPPVPKYASFWDVETVLTYIRAMGENAGLLLRDLGMKLAVLLALTTAGRSSDLGRLDTAFMNDLGERIVFFVREPTKTRKAGSPPSKVEVCSFEDEILSPLACLNEYLRRTIALRSTTKSKLFLASVTPYNPVKSCTIAGWIKTILERAGIDTGVWTAHSTRGASTSKVASMGLSLDVVLTTACWKRVGTFKKFYKKPIEKEIDREKFTQTVLK